MANIPLAFPLPLSIGSNNYINYANLYGFSSFVRVFVAANGPGGGTTSGSSGSSSATSSSTGSGVGPFGNGMFGAGGALISATNTLGGSTLYTGPFAAAAGGGGNANNSNIASIYSGGGGGGGASSASAGGTSAGDGGGTFSSGGAFGANSNIGLYNGFSASPTAPVRTGGNAPAAGSTGNTPGATGSPSQGSMNAPSTGMEGSPGANPIGGNPFRLKLPGLGGLGPPGSLTSPGGSNSP